MSQKLLERALNLHAETVDENQPDPFEPQFKQVAGFTLRYARGPVAERPNMVLLNGMPQSIRCWESAWPALTGEFNLLAIDMPGFGLSPNSPEIMSPSVLADLIPAVLDAFGMEDAYLVGPDVGVPVALATAIRHPNRLRGINIFDGPGSYPPAMDKTLLAAIRYPLLRWLLAGPMKKNLMKLNFQAAVDSGYRSFKPSSRAIREYYKITHNDAQNRCSLAFIGSYKKELRVIGASLGFIETPALITWGERDQFVLPSNATDLHAQLPNAELHILPGAGHYSHEDAGPEYTRILIDWCRRVEAHRSNREKRLAV